MKKLFNGCEERFQINKNKIEMNKVKIVFM